MTMYKKIAVYDLILIFYLKTKNNFLYIKYILTLETL